jgi:beta-glucanase (GH16 family)
MDFKSNKIKINVSIFFLGLTMVFFFQNCGNYSGDRDGASINVTDPSFDQIPDAKVDFSQRSQSRDVQASSFGNQASCYTGGVTTHHGQSRRFYRKVYIPMSWGGDCLPYSMVRTCENGRLSGLEVYPITNERFNLVNCKSPIETVQPLIHFQSVKDDYRLIFHDEFAGDSKAWDKQNSGMWLGGYRVPDRVVIGNGTLEIQNRRGVRALYPAVPTYSDVFRRNIYPSQNESGHMISKEKFKYGYFEIRAKLSRGPSIDTAFWLMDDRGNEIDIFEAFYHNDNKYELTNNLHPRHPGTFDRVVEMPKSLSQVKFLTDQLWQNYHIYGLLWTPERIVWLVDGMVIRTESRPNIVSHFNSPLKIRISTAVSNVWKKSHGGVGLNSMSYNSEFKVDYVRAFEVKN